MLDFPSAPTLNQKYPATPQAGIPTYRWDGEKWTTVGGSIVGKTPILSDGSVPMSGQLTVVNPPVNPTDAVAKAYVDAADASMLKYSAQTLTEAQRLIARQNISAAPMDAMAWSGMQINGAMEISQEKRINTATTGSGNYIMDGWALGVDAGPVLSAIQGLNADIFPGLPYLLHVGTTTAVPSLAAAAYAGVYQPIEGLRTARLGWGKPWVMPVTLCFWSCHNRAGLYAVTIQNHNTTRSCVVTYTQAVSSVAQFNKITIPGDTNGFWNVDNTTGLYLTFTIAAGANYRAPAAGVWNNGNFATVAGTVNAVAATSDVFRMTGVCLLPGSEGPNADRATLIMRPPTQELLTCQRYYETTYPDGDIPGTAYGAAAGGYALGAYIWASGNHYATMIWNYKVRKRAPMSVRAFSPYTGAAGKMRDQNGNVDVAAGGNAGIVAMTVSSQGTPMTTNNFHWVHAVADCRLT